jgi:hypothetical protein
MKNQPEYTYLPSIVLFSAFIFFTIVLCVLLYLSATLWS